MKLRVNLISCLLAFALVLSVFGLVQPVAYASDVDDSDVLIHQFYDISPNDVWYDAVCSLTDAGILTGMSDGCFSPGSFVTARQVLAMSARLIGRDVDEVYFSERLIDDAVFDFVLPFSIDPDLPVTQESAVVLLFRMLGGLPACNMTISVICDDSDMYDFAVNVFSDYGILSALHIDPLRKDRYITRGDFALILDSCRKLLDGSNYSNVLRSCGFGYMPIVATEKYVSRVYQLVAYMMTVPFNILQTYHDSDYGIVFDDEYILEYGREHPEHVNGVVGLFSPSHRRIYVSEPYAIVHELGHFTARYLVGVDDVKPYYEQEKDACVDVLGTYATNNHKEFFSECFRYLMFWKNDADKLALMREKMPSTYQYFLDLAECDYVKIPLEL